MSFRSAFRISLFVWSVAPLACAVATGEPDADPDEGGSGSGGSLVMGGSGGTSPVTMTTAGKTTSTGGTSMAFGGTSSTSAGKGGSSSAGGKTSTAGEGGTTSSAGKAGSSSAAGSSAAGSSSGGTGTGTGTGSCSALRTWVPDSSMMIKADEVIQWMGKRYKATQAIDWTNAICHPDGPADWCATWFMADGSC